MDDVLLVVFYMNVITYPSLIPMFILLVSDNKMASGIANATIHYLQVMVFRLSHQGGVLTATARHPRKIHNAKVRALKCSRLERRRIAVASPWHLHWTPWGILARHATARILCMHKLRAVARCSHCNLNERRGNAVRTQRQRRKSAVKSPWAPRGRRVHAAGTPQERRSWRWRLRGDLTESMEMSPRPHGASTAFALRLHRIAFIPLRLTEITQSCHGNHCAPWRSHGVLRRLQGVCRAFAGRWNSDQSASWITIYKIERHTSYFYESVAPIRNFQRWYEWSKWIK